MDNPNATRPSTLGSPLPHHIGDLSWYVVLGVALYLACHRVIPTLELSPRLAWFVAAAPLFAAMFPIAWGIVASERRALAARGLPVEALRVRLRLTGLGPEERRWLWRGLALAGVGMVAVYGGSHGLAALTGADLGIEPAPSFMNAAPLTGTGWWVMAAWPPFFFLNIVGEELLWRGALLPRHESVFGRRAWLVNAIGWLLFHAAFGLGLCLMVAPMIVAQAWVCQRSRSTTVGIALHALINGLGFIAGTLVAM